MAEADDNQETVLIENYGLGDVYKAEVAIILENGLHMLYITILDEENSTIQKLEALPVMGQIYAFSCLRYEDLNEDGQNDIVVEYEFMTGIGAEGAIPRLGEAHYLRQGDGSFALAPREQMTDQ